MPRISEEEQEVDSKVEKVEQEKEIQLVTENQLLNAKLDHIIAILENKD